MKVPMLDLGAQLATIEDDMKRALIETLESTRYIMGPQVSELEAAVADMLGVGHAIGVSSGTDALVIALMALGIGPGDVVVTTTYSFFATAGAVSRVGARPAFVDIDAATCNMCPRALATWFDDNRDIAARVKAIIPVHLFGQCADMEPVLALARSRVSA